MKQKSIIVIIFVFAMIIVGVMNISFYQEEINEFKNETLLSLTIDGVVSESFPSKESGKTIESIECDNEAIASWDYESWGPVIKNLNQNRTKCQFNFVTKYHEEILNGTDPVLKEGLIPVTIENDGTVRKAYAGREWYKYSKQKWANAVILEDESKKYYEGDIIPESEIESYFVWIPKYRYKLWNLGNYTGLTSFDTSKVQTIEILFGDYDTKDSISGECSTPGVSGSSGNCSVGDYMTHPAFLSFGTKGLWIGKFETGYKGATSTAEAQQNVNDVEKVEIKPNVYSWRVIQLSNMHLNSYNYKREYDSHMMKNTEWGAVAYLQYSIYGSREKLRINNNSSFITGYSATNAPTCIYTATNEECNRYEGTNLNQDGNNTKRYNSETGYLASTTGNITGIYDMSGGAHEYMMDALSYSSGQPCVGKDASNTSGFTGAFCNGSGNATGISFPEQKYFNIYAYEADDEHFNRRILGDATGEMGPFATITWNSITIKSGSWYGERAYFIYTNESWFARSGTYFSGVEAGMFMFDQYHGRGSTDIGYRIVLTI